MEEPIKVSFPWGREEEEEEEGKSTSMGSDRAGLDPSSAIS